MSEQQSTIHIPAHPVKVIVPDVADFQGDDEKGSEARTTVLSYLKHFGFAPTDAEADAENVSNALKTFQKLSNLRVTGSYDEATKELMAKPRCAYPDVVREEKTEDGETLVAFDAWPEKFTKTELTYRIEVFTPDLTPFKIRRAISDGFSCWAAVTPLSFKEVSTGGDIVLRFTIELTDGPFGQIARGFALSTVVFDEAEDWGRSIDLAAVALHEIGHVLGLGHSSVPNSTMNPGYGSTYFDLHPDDIHGIHSKYGWRDPMWRMVSGADSNIKSILTSSNMLFKLNTNGHVWQYLNSSPTGWQEIGNTPGTLEMVCENRIIYAFTQSGAIQRWEGAPLTWTTIDLNQDCAQVLVGGSEVYQRHLNTTRNYAAIYRFRGMSAVPRWELIDDNPRTRQIAVDGSGPLYQRHDNGSLWRYVGPGIKWELVNDNSGATLIAAGMNGTLFYSDRFGTITRYTKNGTTETYQRLIFGSIPTLTLVAKGEHMCVMRNDKSLWRFTGQPFTGWERIDAFSNTAEFTLSETGEIYQRHTDGAIWRLAV